MILAPAAEARFVRQRTHVLMTHAAMKLTGLFAISACGASMLMPPPQLPPPDLSSQLYAVVLDTFVAPKGIYALVAESTIALRASVEPRSRAPDGFASAVDGLDRVLSERRLIAAIPTSSERVLRITSAQAQDFRRDGGRALREQFHCQMTCAFLISFSQVGLSADSTKAVIYFGTWCSGVCASSELLYLTQAPGARWTIVERVSLGAS